MAQLIVAVASKRGPASGHSSRQEQMKVKSAPEHNGFSAAWRDKRRVMLVDDHPVVREGLSQLIDHEADLAVCGQFEDAARAFDAIPRLLPDLTIVDLSLKGGSGLELVKNARSNYPKLLILVLSMHDESLYAERALRAGAAGYIMKQEAVGRVLGAIRHVLNGGVYLSEKMNSKLMHQLARGKSIGDGSLTERLSDRELEVFGLIGQGRGTRQIAEQLHLSVKTIESHRAHIKEKLDLKSSTELVHCAIELRRD
jgi:DNA-binding NarL/FixJ family response regulator